MVKYPISNKFPKTFHQQTLNLLFARIAGFFVLKANS